MKKISIMILLTSLFLITGNCNLLSCTIFNATKSGITLVGNNEDGTDPITYVWFLPAEKSKYGRVYFGLSDKWPQGGMNDRGLFYDGTACPLLEVKKSKNKPIYNGNLSEKILEECSTVDEALELLGKYNLNYFRNGETTSFTGDLVTYYENRQKHRKRTFKNGKKDGIFIEWDKNGLKIKEEIFQDNVLIKVNRFR